MLGAEGGLGGGGWMRWGKNEVIRSRLSIFSFLLVIFSYCGCDYFYSFSQFHQSLDAGPDVFVCRCCMPWCEGWIPLFSSQPTARFIQPSVPSPHL